MYNASDLRKGLKVEVDGQPWEITEFDFCKPGKGTALYRCKLKNLITGSTMDRTWRPNDRLDKPNLEEREMAYAYHDGVRFVFSDDETYEELAVDAKILGDQQYFLIENAPCKILFYNDQPIEVTLPIFVEKVIVSTEPAVRGDTATNVTKPAILDNGYELAVPLFINQGDRVKIDTRTGLYSERVSKK
jgi:elongation factor P